MQVPRNVSSLFRNFPFISEVTNLLNFCSKLIIRLCQVKAAPRRPIEMSKTASRGRPRTLRHLSHSVLPVSKDDFESWYSISCFNEINVVSVMAPSFYNSVLTPWPDSVIGIPLLSIFMSPNPFIGNESWDSLELFDQNLFFTPSQQNTESFLIRLARFEIKGLDVEQKMIQIWTSVIFPVWDQFSKQTCMPHPM